MISLAPSMAAAPADAIVGTGSSASPLMMKGKGMISRTLRRVFVGALTIGLGIVLAGSLTTPASAASAPAHDASFVNMLNALRVSRGLAPLTVNGELSNVARAWSEKMASSGTLAHNPALRSQVQNWEKIGENVAFGGAVDRVFRGLVGSPGHLKNMYDSGYTMLGVGTVTDRTGLLWTTHVFMRPRGSGAALAAPRPAAPPVTRAPTVRAAASNPSPRPAAPAAPAAASTPAAPVTTAAAPPGSPAAVRTAVNGGPTSADLAAAAAPDSSTGPTSSQWRIIGPFVGAAVLVLLVLGGTAFLVRRSLTSGRKSVPLPGRA